MLSNLLQHKRLLFILGLVLGLSIFSAVIMFKQIENIYAGHEEQYNKMMLQEAISHFEDMLISRQWNAQHGGVYVKQENGLQPNPYLKDNIKTMKEIKLLEEQINKLEVKKFDLDV